MNLSLTCEISLSKKLRSIIGDNKANVVLSISEIQGGIGCGTLVISSDNKLDVPVDLLNKETSIMITPKEVGAEIINIDSPVLSIFNDKDIKTPRHQIKRSGIDRLAAVNIPENNYNTVFKTQDEINDEVPEELKIEENAIKSQKYISSLAELLTSINEAKSKIVDINIDDIQDKKQRALEIERKEMMEAIDNDAWIVNPEFSSICINDLGIQLLRNSPLNLNRFSAKRLSMSKDLQSYIKNGQIKLISPKEAEQYLNLGSEQEIIGAKGLDIYDSHSSAERKVFDEDEKGFSRSTVFHDRDSVTKKSQARQVKSVADRAMIDDGGDGDEVLDLSADIDSPSEMDQILRSTRFGTPLPESSKTELPPRRQISSTNKAVTLAGNASSGNASSGNAGIGNASSGNVLSGNVGVRRTSHSVGSAGGVRSQVTSERVRPDQTNNRAIGVKTVTKK